MPKVTLQDIAKAAGVSVNTVSRALNNKTEISPKTRRRILEIARRLQYRPNLVAKGLALGRTHTLGVVLPNNASPFYAEVISGIQEYAEEHGYSIILANNYGSRRQESEAVDVLLQRRVDGVILFLRENSWLEDYLEAGTAFVVAGGRVLDEPVLGIATDDRAGARRAVEHLIKQGRRRIAYLGSASSSPPARDRWSGYKSALEGAGLPIIPAVDVDRGNEAVYSFARDAADISDYDAVFAFNDQMAIALLRGLHDRGVRVPDDIAVIGYDDIELARYSKPSLSTVRIPKREMGRQAANLLIRQVERKEESDQGSRDFPVAVDMLLRPEEIRLGAKLSENGRTLLLPTELVIRESSHDW